MEGDRKTLKKIYSVICRTKMDYGCQLYNIGSAGRIKKLDRIHREGIIIYTGAFRTSPVEVLHVKTNNPPLKLRRNKLGLRFLYKTKKQHHIHRHTKYTERQRGPELKRKLKVNKTSMLATENNRKPSNTKSDI